MLLAGRHRLHSGRAREVAALILVQHKKLPQLIECLWDDAAGVANRAAPWKDALLGLLAEARENKLRWNLALSVPRIKLSAVEAQRAAAALRTYLEDRSSIVKTAAMQGLADLTRHDPSLLPEVLDMLRILSRSGTPAMRARGRILLKKLEAPRKRTLPTSISTL